MAHFLTARSYMMMALLSVVLLVAPACGPPPAPTPPVSDAIYDPTFTMVYNAIAKRYSVHFDGKLSYHSNPTNCVDETFTFLNHPLQPATLEVWISDTAGVQPGERFQYNLVFDGVGGGTVESLQLVADNPLGATGKVFDYKYVIQTNSIGSNPSWTHPGAPVEGDYSIVTERALTVSLKFTLRKTVNGATGPACGLPR